MKSTFKVLTRLIPLFVLLFIISCSEPLTPVTPTWDLKMNVPVCANNYTMEELLSFNSTLTENEKQTILQNKNIVLTNQKISTTEKIHYTVGESGLLDDVLNGVFVMKVENRFPIDITIQAEYVDENGNLLLNPTSNGSTIAHIPASTSTNGNTARSAQQTETTINITADDVRKLFSSEYVRYTLVISTPQGAPVQFYVNDFIDLRASVSLNLGSKSIVR